MENQTNVYDKSYKDFSCSRPFHSLSWSGIVSGALVAVGLSFLLNMLCMAVGLSAFTLSDQGILTLAIGGFIGMLVGIVIVMFISGLISGYGAKSCGHQSCGGALHGLISWCLALLITIIFATAAGNFMTNNFYALAKGSEGVIAFNQQNPGNARNSEQDQYDHQNQTATKNNEETGQDTDSVNNNSNPSIINTSPANINKNIPTDIKETTMEATHAAGGVTFATFILFLTAALASMCGGYFGTQCKRESEQ